MEKYLMELRAVYFLIWKMCRAGFSKLEKDRAGLALGFEEKNKDGGTEILGVPPDSPSNPFKHSSSGTSINRPTINICGIQANLAQQATKGFLTSLEKDCSFAQSNIYTDRRPIVPFSLWSGHRPNISVPLPLCTVGNHPCHRAVCPGRPCKRKQ